MSAASALACLKGGCESDQYQDDASREQKETTVVLIGNGDIADKGDHPAFLGREAHGHPYFPP
jgi:hypothetical protein